MQELRTIKCSKCKCWRKESEFFRRNKQWKTCNQCCKRLFFPKYKSSLCKTCPCCKRSVLKESFARREKAAWKTCNDCSKAYQAELDALLTILSDNSSDNESSAACPPDFFN